MDIKTFGMMAFVAASFVAWPNLGKALKINGGLVAVVVVAVTLVVLLITSHKDIAQLRSISVNAFMWVIAISVANGLAVYMYAEKATDQNVSTGMLLVTVIALQMLFSPLFDWLITKSMPTWQQFVGIGLVVPGIWLIAIYGRQQQH